jgi:hypothetical protein
MLVLLPPAADGCATPAGETAAGIGNKLAFAEAGGERFDASACRSAEEDEEGAEVGRGRCDVGIPEDEGGFVGSKGTGMWRLEGVGDADEAAALVMVAEAGGGATDRLQFLPS